MKKFFAYLIYIAITLLVTFAFHFITTTFVSMMRFSAADGPPGDIERSTRMMMSIGAPLFYLGCITLFFFLYRSIVEVFSVNMKKMPPLLLNVLLTTFLIGSFYQAFVVS